MNDMTKLTNATCLTEGHVTAAPATVELTGDVQSIGEREMLMRVPMPGYFADRNLKPIDSIAVMDAFERYGGPNFFTGRFVLSADGLVYACDPERRPTHDYLRNVLTIVGMLGGEGRRGTETNDAKPKTV